MSQNTNDIVQRFKSFLKNAKNAHKDKYDYSLAKYVNSHTKIKIICPKHGTFTQLPTNHLSGHGCSECGGNLKSNITKFIKQSTIIHNNKYDYSSVEYANNKDKIKIICPQHGTFLQTPNNHLRGAGCKKCADYLRMNNTDEFIEACKIIHNNNYDYSLVRYTGSKNKIKIICPTHGIFLQGAGAHLSGGGCRKCANHALLTTNEQFIEKSNKIHHGKYDYSKTKYDGIFSKIYISCPVMGHGEFLQSPEIHLKGFTLPQVWRSRIF